MSEQNENPMNKVLGGDSHEDTKGKGKERDEGGDEDDNRSNDRHGNRNNRRNRGMERVFDRLSKQEQVLAQIPGLLTEIRELKEGVTKVVEKKGPEPKLSDFDGDVDKYAEAMRNHYKPAEPKVETQAEKDNKKRVQEEQDKPTREKFAAHIGVSLEQLEDFDDLLEDARDKYDDFDEVAAKASSVAGTSALLTRALTESEKTGAELVYYLGKHPKKAKEIAGMTRFRDVVKALEELESEIEAEEAEDSDSEPKEKSPKNAEVDTRKPISPVGGRSVKGKKDESTESDDDFFTRKNKEFKAKGSLV